MINYFRYNHIFELENGEKLDSVEIAYHCYGKFSKETPVIWVCHALTANSDVSDWWAGLFGKDKTLDPEKYFIICPNNLGDRKSVV